MARKRGIPEYIWEIETNALMAFMYENDLERNMQQFSKYHFRFKGKRTVDVWPGRRKYYVQGANSSKSYTKPEELKEFLIVEKTMTDSYNDEMFDTLRDQKEEVSIIIEPAAMKSLADEGYYQGRLSNMESCIIGKDKAELEKTLLLLKKVQNG